MELNRQSTYSRYQVNNLEVKPSKKNEPFLGIVIKKENVNIENNTVKISKQERIILSSESQRDVTDDKYYKNAPDFKAFIQKWMDRGHSESAAVERASFYARAGLLDYGEQTLIIIDDLGYGDKNQHGFHLINNNILKNSMLETFDSLDNEGVGVIIHQLFRNNTDLTTNNYEGESSTFQKLINEFSIKLNELGGLSGLDNKKYSSYKNKQFDGNINITNQMTQFDKNFINDVLIEYFKDHINKISLLEEKHNEPLDEARNAFNLLLHNFEKKVEEDNDNYKALNEYTKNSRPNILLNN
ncbi:hypothetical protein [Poseidonibacter lekithochrous]|uniref:hypothetical protein n=1 Tax=Poseidonibacter lekithochrous TaxID=1904463 RepID=UPI000D355B76|nr:hypothetical protein [Poseidonibacter lekithochrous]